MMLGDARDGPVRPVIRTFYDHLQVTKLPGPDETIATRNLADELYTSVSIHLPN